jgi:hypothetical protein
VLIAACSRGDDTSHGTDGSEILLDHVRRG